MGWIIVAHSIALILRNLRNALLISLVPLFIGLVAVWLVFRLTGVSAQMIVFSMMMGRAAPQIVVVISLSLVIFLFVTSWIAVAWHRFILLEEYPRLIPPLHAGRIAAYTGHSLLLAALMLVVMFPVAAITGQIAGILGLAIIPGFSLLLGFVLTTALTYIWLRLAIVLPATALGRDYSLSRGWNDGARLSRDILYAAGIVALINLVAGLALDLIPPVLWLVIVTQAALVWFTMMLGTGLLTTLYGHLVERRPLG